MRGYVIAEVGPECPTGFAPRGGALALWRSRDHEVILSGPAETGKTWAAINKLDALCWKYPGVTAVVIRKTLASLQTSVLRTYKLILGKESPVKFFGGEKPEWADYPNGSRVYFAGFDNPQKALSSERDYIYVNQAEELRLDDWETLTTRCTGRAGVAPYPQILADCNPGPPSHWILHRPSLRVLHSRHEDNPTLFDEAGQITAQGMRTLAILDALTGVRKSRLRHGKWVQAEGVVYEGFDRSLHTDSILSETIAARSRRHVAGVDWGYTNPGSLEVCAVDGDSRMALVAEVYRAHQLIGWWIERAKELHRRYGIEVFACDPSEPAYIDQFRQAGLPAINGFNALAPGIQAVQSRLATAPDGRPRLVFDPSALAERDEDLAAARRPCSVLDEIEVYCWPQGSDGKPRKEVPVDEHNHGCDALRYAVAYVDGLGGGGVSEAPDPLDGYRG